MDIIFGEDVKSVVKASVMSGKSGFSETVLLSELCHAALRACNLDGILFLRIRMLTS